MSGRAPTAPTVKVWDPFVRLFHWSLVTAVVLAWLSGEGWGVWHELVGYVALALVALRLPWGWLGSRHARFAGFVRSPPVTLRYARLVARRAEPRHLGHNPLGGWMILALITAVLAATITGWLYTTDRFWGVEWMANLHGFCADSLIVLATVHVLGVIAASIRHRENLVAAMIHGHKRAPAPGDME